jgi:hypothetical protein
MVETQVNQQTRINFDFRSPLRVLSIRIDGITAKGHLRPHR